MDDGLLIWLVVLGALQACYVVAGTAMSEFRCHGSGAAACSEPPHHRIMALRIQCGVLTVAALTAASAVTGLAHYLPALPWRPLVGLAFVLAALTGLGCIATLPRMAPCRTMRVLGKPGRLLADLVFLPIRVLACPGTWRLRRCRCHGRRRGDAGKSLPASGR